MSNRDDSADRRKTKDGMMADGIMRRDSDGTKGNKLIARIFSFLTWTDDLYRQGRISQNLRRKYIEPLDWELYELARKVMTARDLYFSDPAPPKDGTLLTAADVEKVRRQNRRDAIAMANDARRNVIAIRTRWRIILGLDRESGNPLIPGIIPQLSHKRRFVFQEVAEIDAMLGGMVRWMARKG